MFTRFLFRALLYRKQRVLLAFAALSVAALLATVLFGIYGSVERRLREEFKSYGANLVAVASQGDTIPFEIAAAAERAGAEASPFLITAARLDGMDVAIAGFIPEQAGSLTSYWHVDGIRKIQADDCLAGETIARTHRLAIGQRLTFDRLSCTVRGIVSTGAEEDRELLVPYAAAERVAGLSDAASLIEIRVPADRLNSVQAQLSKQFPFAEIRTVRSVAGTETNVVFKIRASLFLLTLIILLITTLCVSSNFSELVIERSKEIGILKALGAAERRIAAFFLSESAVLALMATVLGYLSGLIAAAAIGREIFGGAFRLEPNWLVFFSVALVMLLVAAFATAISASRVWSIQPAAILRGE